jgi:hypothetical protein
LTKSSVVEAEKGCRWNKKQNYPFLNFHALLLQVLCVGYSGKLDKGRAENFISRQEIQLLVTQDLHESKIQRSLLG